MIKIFFGFVRRWASTVVPVFAAASIASASAQSFYRLESALVIKSPNVPNWDYLAFDPASSKLFIARREDGILIYDTRSERLVGVIDNTKGGNATTLVPEFDRGYVTNLDGTLTVFRLSDLKTLDRIRVGADADNTFFDPVTNQLIVTMGDSKQAAFVDAKTGALIGTLAIDSEKLEGTVADGKGNFLMALRDRNRIIRIDARQRKITADWPTEGCELPNGLAFDAINRRALIGCRGVKPVLLIMDADTGRTTGSQPIGRGVDQVIFDPSTKTVYTSNGFDGNVVVLQQVSPDGYRLVEAPTTRPFARTMALDPQTKRLFLVTAEGTVDPSRKNSTGVTQFYPNKYFNDTFTLLTYRRQ